MAAQKLTLSVDPSVVDAAKRYAAERGTSVSRLVEDFLAAVSSVPTNTNSVVRRAVPAKAPVLERLRGALRGVQVDEDDHRRHLFDTYC